MPLPAEFTPLTEPMRVKGFGEDPAGQPAREFLGDFRVEGHKNCRDFNWNKPSRGHTSCSLSAARFSFDNQAARSLPLHDLIDGVFDGLEYLDLVIARGR